MAKYRDNRKCRFQAGIGYVEGEAPKARHERRQIHNVQELHKLQNYCRSNGFILKVTNENMHWQIRRGDIQIDWWPRTAKMVVNQHWKRGIHVHDIKQLKSYLDFILLL